MVKSYNILLRTHHRWLNDKILSTADRSSEESSKGSYHGALITNPIDLPFSANKCMPSTNAPAFWLRSFVKRRLQLQYLDQNYLQQVRRELTILLEYLIFLPVIVHCRCVGQQNVMCSKIWLWWGGGIPSYTRGTPSGWKYSDSVSQRHKQICLIHCRPVFNPITECPEANLCIGFEVLASHRK